MISKRAGERLSDAGGETREEEAAGSPARRRGLNTIVFQNFQFVTF